MADESLAAEFRARVGNTARALLERARSIETRLRAALEPFETDELTGYADFYQTLERSNSHFPIGEYTDYHTKDWSVSSGFVSSAPQNLPDLESYRELTEQEKSGWIARWQRPVVEACSALFADAKQLFIDAAGRLVVLRRLNGFQQTLEQLGEALKPPWARPIKLPPHRDLMVPAWAWRSNAPLRTPFYLRLDATREANLDTLRIAHEKTRALRAILEAILEEIPISALLSEPSPIPKVLIQIEKLISTSIGDNANIEGSAIGPEASVDR